jgi:hypothetical protein
MKNYAKLSIYDQPSVTGRSDAPRDVLFFFDDEDLTTIAVALTQAHHAQVRAGGRLSVHHRTRGTGTLPVVGEFTE